MGGEREAKRQQGSRVEGGASEPVSARDIEGRRGRGRREGGGGLCCCRCLCCLLSVGCCLPGEQEEQKEAGRDRAASDLNSSDPWTSCRKRHSDSHPPAEVTRHNSAEVVGRRGGQERVGVKPQSLPQRGVWLGMDGWSFFFFFAVVGSVLPILPALYFCFIASWVLCVCACVSQCVTDALLCCSAPPPHCRRDVGG